MKTLPLITSVAALVAFFLVPSPALAGSLFFTVSLLTIFVADYSRVIKPLASRATVVGFPGTVRSAPACELAA